MVQVQSTWFPVHDRNPQKFVDNIYKATDAAYVKTTQKDLPLEGLVLGGVAAGGESLTVASPCAVAAVDRF